MTLAALFLGIVIIVGLELAALCVLCVLEDTCFNRGWLCYALVAVCLAILTTGHEVYRLASTIIAATG